MSQFKCKALSEQEMMACIKSFGKIESITICSETTGLNDKTVDVSFKNPDHTLQHRISHVPTLK